MGEQMTTWQSVKTMALVLATGIPMVLAVIGMVIWDVIKSCLTFAAKNTRK